MGKLYRVSFKQDGKIRAHMIKATNDEHAEQRLRDLEPGVEIIAVKEVTQEVQGGNDPNWRPNPLRGSGVVVGTSLLTGQKVTIVKKPF